MNKTRKIALGFAVVLAVVIAVLLVVTKTSKLEQANVPSENNTEVLSQEYKSTDFGFSIRLSESWKDYLVNVSEGKITDENNNVVADPIYHFSFMIPTTDKNWLDNGSTRGQAFGISAFPKSQLSKLEIECSKPDVYFFNCLPLTAPLAENNKYVFTYLRTDKITDHPADFVGTIFEQADLAKATFKTFDTNVSDVSGSLTEGNVIKEWKLVEGEAQDTCTIPTFTGEAIVYGWYEYSDDFIEKTWQFHVSDQDIYNIPTNQLYNADGSSLLPFYKKNPWFHVFQRYTTHTTNLNIVKISQDLETKLKNASEQKPYPIKVTQFSQYCEGSGVLVVQE